MKPLEIGDVIKEICGSSNHYVIARITWVSDDARYYRRYVSFMSWPHKIGSAEIWELDVIDSVWTEFEYVQSFKQQLKELL